MRQALLSPQEFLSYEMGRLLLVLWQWNEKNGGDIEFDRAMLIDFAVRSPRQISELIEGFADILETNGISEMDVGDLFARRQFEGIRQTFSVTVSALMARGLLVQRTALNSGGELFISLSEDGKRIAGKFTSVLSAIYLEMIAQTCREWKRKNPTALMALIFSRLPDTSAEVNSLTRPFELWKDE